MRKTAKVKLICLIAVIVMAAAILLCVALRREPPSASQDPPVASPGPVLPTPTPSIIPEPEPTPTPEPSPEVTSTPEPTEPPYDVWSDPNVLWAMTWGDILSTGWQNGEVLSSKRLDYFTETAEEGQMIAFYVKSYSRESNSFQIKIEELDIYHRLDEDGKLTKLIEEYCKAPSSRTYDDINMYLKSVTGETVIEYTGPYESHRSMFESRWASTSLEWEREQIIRDNANELMNEWGVERFPKTEEERDEWYKNWEEAWQQATEIALKDEWYQKTVEITTYYGFMQDMERIFWNSWNRQRAEYIRERMMELGFTPVNEMEDLLRDYDPYEALTFVGTVEQIRSLNEKLHADETLKIEWVVRRWANQNE